MPRIAKFLIGLSGALLAGWIGHGPLGQGEAFVGRLEAQANGVIRTAELPAVHARFSRDPLTREAILTGPANEFQREGQGQFPGLNDRIRGIAGVSRVRWENDTVCCAQEEAGNAAAR
jgi:hypothetical protein